MGGYNSSDSNQHYDQNYNGTNNYGYQYAPDLAAQYGGYSGIKPGSDTYSGIDLNSKDAKGMVPTEPQYPEDPQEIMKWIEMESESGLRTMAGLWDSFTSNLSTLRDGIVRQTDLLAVGGDGKGGWPPSKSAAAAAFVQNVGKTTWSLEDWITFGQQNAAALRQVADQVVKTKKKMRDRYKQFVAANNAQVAIINQDVQYVNEDNEHNIGGWLSRHLGGASADAHQLSSDKNTLSQIKQQAAKDLADDMKELAGVYIDSWAMLNEGRKFQGPKEAESPLAAYAKRMAAIVQGEIAAQQAALRAAAARQQQLAQQMRQQMQTQMRQQMQREQQQLALQQEQLRQQMAAQQRQLQQQLALEQQALQQEQRAIAQQQAAAQQQLAQAQAAAQAALAAQQAALRSQMAGASRSIAAEEAAMRSQMAGLTSETEAGLSGLGLTRASGLNGLNPRSALSAADLNEMGGSRPSLSGLSGRSMAGGMAGMRSMMGRGPMNPGMRGQRGAMGAEGEEESSPGSRAPMGGRGDKKLSADGKEAAARAAELEESEENLGLNETPTAPELLAGRLGMNAVETSVAPPRPMMPGRLGSMGPGRGPMMPGSPRGNQQLTNKDLTGRRKRAAEAETLEEELLTPPTLLRPDLTGRNGTIDIDWDAVRNGEIGVDKEMLGVRAKPAPAPEESMPSRLASGRRKKEKAEEAAQDTSGTEEKVAEEELWTVETPEAIATPTESATEEKRGRVLGLG